MKTKKYHKLYAWVELVQTRRCLAGMIITTIKSSISKHE